MEMISVIVPACNVEKYISKCLDSLINQTYTNLEIIIVDDASTDKTRYICEEYLKKDKRIKYIRHDQNCGQSNARNTGLDNVKGDYIAFVDSDDCVTPEYFSILHKNLRDNDADISICECEWVNEGEQINLPELENNVRVYNNNEKYYPFFGELAPQWIVPWAHIYKKYIFINLRYVPFQAFEDINLSHKVISKAKRVVYTSKKMYYYLQRTDSVSNKDNKNSAVKRLGALDGLYDRLIFFGDTLNNKNLYEMAIMSFWWNWIAIMYMLQRFTNDTKTYEQLAINRYDIMGDVLNKVKELEGTANEYNEDFSKFANLNVPLEYVYRKISVSPNVVDIKLNNEKCAMKASYEIINNDTEVKILRLFFQNNISNWEGKDGIEVDIKTSLPNKVVKVSIVSPNLVMWFYDLKTDENGVIVDKIKFADFCRDERFEHVPKQGGINLKRVLNLVFSWGTDFEEEKGYIEFRKIKV